MTVDLIHYTCIINRYVYLYHKFISLICNRQRLYHTSSSPSSLLLSSSSSLHSLLDKYIPQARTIRQFFQQLLPNEYKVGSYLSSPSSLCSIILIITVLFIISSTTISYSPSSNSSNASYSKNTISLYSME